MPKIEMGKIYRLADGRQYEMHKIYDVGAHPVHGSVFDGRAWLTVSHTIDGRISAACSVASPYDLVEVKPRHKVVRWVNVYPNGDMVHHMTRESAEFTRDKRCVACIRVEFEYEEGEGLGPVE